MLKHPLFLIIDGMSQAYRAYFAIRGLASTQGLPTNAVYGFAIMLKRVLAVPVSSPPRSFLSQNPEPAAELSKQSSLPC